MAAVQVAGAGTECRADNSAAGFRHGDGPLMHVEPRDGESFDQLLRRFKTSIDKSGILREYKRKRYFKTNSELQREKAKAAARRRTRRPKIMRGPRPQR
jgi:small subunit ribosomal protein S21